MAASINSSPPERILSVGEVRRLLGISKSAWRTHYRHRIEIVRLTPRRLGIRESIYQKLLADLSGAAA